MIPCFFLFVFSVLKTNSCILSSAKSMNHSCSPCQLPARLAFILIFIPGYVIWYWYSGAGILTRALTSFLGGGFLHPWIHLSLKLVASHYLKPYCCYPSYKRTCPFVPYLCGSLCWFVPKMGMTNIHHECKKKYIYLCGSFCWFVPERVTIIIHECKKT